MKTEDGQSYSTNVRMWLELPMDRGVKRLLEVASVGNGDGTLVAESVPWGTYLMRSDLADLCIEIDGTVRRYNIRILDRENEMGEFNYEKIE